MQHYIRLTSLIPELLNKLDTGEMALSVGVELSYLDEQRQRDVLKQCEINDCTPSYSQAVLPQGLNVAETEDYVIKACEHYRKFQRRANRNDEVQHERVMD